VPSPSSEHYRARIRSTFLKRLPAAWLLTGLVCLLLTGCLTEVDRHQYLTALLDGVPELPEEQQLCDEYYLQRRAAEEAGTFQAATDGETENRKRSSHKPYREKKCNDCHSGDKSTSGGLIVPKQELCGVCHKDFVTGNNVHGPVAVGDCLACHLPHNSNEVSLLKAAPDEICGQCHQEERLAAGMHNRLHERGMGCMECHDAHSGDARYFLK